MISLSKTGMVGLLLTLLVGCSGAKVTSKAGPQLAQYRVQKLVLVPFETIETPQALQLDGRTLPVPAGARRSDMGVAVPPPTGQFDRPTHLVPPDTGAKVTDLMWAKLKSKPGLEIISPAEATRAAKELALEPASRSASANKIAQR